MNKTARNIFRLCVAARNLRKIPRCETWVCYSRTATLPYSSNTNIRDNELSMIRAFPNKDPIMEAICKAQTADDIFNIVENHSSSFKLRHVIQAFKQFDQPHILKDISGQSIEKRIEFIQLCEILSNNIRSLDAIDAIHILKRIRYFGIPTTSVIVQSLLQFIRSSLDQININHLLNLNYQLRDFHSTPLVDALKCAIPMMCEIRVNNQMIDTSNIMELTSTLLFLSENRAKKETIDIVINAIRELGQNMNVVHARRILKYLSDCEYLPPSYEEVVHNVLQVLTRGMMELPIHDIYISLEKTVKKVVYHGNKNFYNEEFVDACAKIIISKDIGFHAGVRILRSLCLLQHTQIRLIDYLAAKCFEKPKLLNDSDAHTIVNLIRGLAVTDYKPIFWESMQAMKLTNVIRNTFQFESTLLEFTVCMAVLDCFDSELISMVFTPYFIQHSLKKDGPRNSWYLLLLYQSVRLLYPNYDGAWPPEAIIAAAMQSNGPPVRKSLLLPILETAMGGSQYVLSNLKSKLGHHIDHVVIMRKGGYPVAVNPLSEDTVAETESVVYIEDLPQPAESQVIIVMNLPVDAYSVNSKRLIGYWTLLLKTLELQTGHTVIPISSLMWTALMNHEKIPYLMQAIRLKCDTLSVSTNV